MSATSYIAGMFRFRTVSAALGVTAFFGLGAASGCLFDPDNRCDKGQKYDSGSGLCVCVGDTTTGDHNCVACPAHQHRPAAADGGDPATAPDTCVCDDGYALMGTDCVIMAAGQGDACSADNDCADKGAFTSCQMNATGGYCTNTGCTGASDCVGGYGCNTTGATSYCQQPPSGQGMACTKAADCAGTEATYCETFNAHTCFVECSADPNGCFAGYECCDLGPLSGGIIKNKICVVSGSCGT